MEKRVISSKKLENGKTMKKSMSELEADATADFESKPIKHWQFHTGPSQWRRSDGPLRA